MAKTDTPKTSTNFFKSLTPHKAAPSADDKRFLLIACGAGAFIALASMVLLLIQTAGFRAEYVWSALALGLGAIAFFALSAARYLLPGSKLIDRFADASVFLTLFAAYTPIFLFLVKADNFENGSIVVAWVSFGLVALLSFVGLLISAISDGKRLRMFVSFLYLVTAFAPIFSIPALLNAYFFSHVLLYILLIATMVIFAATPILFWFFDSKAWQMKVYYILMAVGTLTAALIPVIFTFCGW